MPSLFGTKHRWVTMFEALGFGLIDRPGYTFAPGTGGGGGMATDGGSGARRMMHKAIAEGRWILSTGRGTEFASEDGKQHVDTGAEPAPTLRTKSGGQWIFARPATTVQGDPRLWPPGHKVNADDRRRLADADDRYGDRAGTESIKMTIGDALRLQSFPADFPVAGRKTRQFEQIGNAIPPLLALHVLGTLLEGQEFLKNRAQLFTSDG